MTNPTLRRAAACVLAATAVLAAPGLPVRAGPPLPDSVAAVARGGDYPYSGPGYLDIGPVPLEMHPVRLGSLETANLLPEGRFMFQMGSVQTDPARSKGTGNQLYFAALHYGASDRLTFGLDLQTYEDPTIDPILGVRPDVDLDGAALFAKYALFQRGPVTVAAQASVEMFRFRINYTYRRQDTHRAASFKLPVTWEVSPKLQFHLTPAVAFFPEEVNSMPNYGTVASLGGGVSYRPSTRLTFYGAAEMPLGPGGNTVTGSAEISNVLVWTAGARLNVTPRTALETFVTNGLGTTPATSTLTHWPGGQEVLYGVRLSYTPGLTLPESYRGRPAPVSGRDVAQQEDGLTMDSAFTIEPGTLRLGGWYGTGDAYGGGFSFAPDRDLQFDLLAEQFADDGSLPRDLRGLRFSAGPRLRFLDQKNGDPLTLSVRGLFGRSLGQSKSGAGVVYAALTGAYDIGDRVTLTAGARLGAFRSTEVYGLSLGADVAVLDRLSLIGEVTPVVGDLPGIVWAAGARYDLPLGNLVVDAHATNAAGRRGIGGLMPLDEVRYVLGLSTSFNLR